MYQRAIPHLKQNVLSARISKHGIRSAVLSEPYVSTVKKLDLGLTGSSHYITVSDFFTICHYFKQQPPNILMNFRFVNSGISSEDVLEMFNNPEGMRGRELIQTLCRYEDRVNSEGRDNVSVKTEVNNSISHSHKEAKMASNDIGISDGTFLKLLIFKYFVIIM